MIPGFGARSGGTGPEGRTPVPVKLVLPVLLGAFGVFGLFWGAYAVLLADLSGALDLTPGPLGVALFAGAAAWDGPRTGSGGASSWFSPAA
jgi:hypothetical protein